MMTAKEDKRLNILIAIMSIGLTLIFAILIAYFPLINNNTIKATDAFNKATNIEDVVNVKLDAIDKKLDIYIGERKEESQNIKDAIENNRENYSELATKLLEAGYVKNLKIRGGKI